MTEYVFEHNIEPVPYDYVEYRLAMKKTEQDVDNQDLKVKELTELVAKSVARLKEQQEETSAMFEQSKQRRQQLKQQRQQLSMKQTTQVQTAKQVQKQEVQEVQQEVKKDIEDTDNLIRQEKARRLVGDFCEETLSEAICDAIITALTMIMLYAETSWYKSWNSPDKFDTTFAEDKANYIRKIHESIVNFYEEGVKNIARDQASQKTVTDMYNQLVSTCSMAYLEGQEFAVLKLLSTMTKQEAQKLKYRMADISGRNFKMFVGGLFKTKLVTYTKAEVKSLVQQQAQDDTSYLNKFFDYVLSGGQQVLNFLTGKPVKAKEILNLRAPEPEEQIDVYRKPTPEEFQQAKANFTGNLAFLNKPLTKFELDQTSEGAYTGQQILSKPESLQFDFTYEDIQTFEGPLSETYKYLTSSYQNMTEGTVQEASDNLLKLVTSEVNKAFAIPQDASMLERFSAWLNRQDKVKVLRQVPEELVHKVEQLQDKMPKDIRPFFEDTPVLAESIGEATSTYTDRLSARLGTSSFRGTQETSEAFGLQGGITIVFYFVFVATMILGARASGKTRGTSTTIKATAFLLFLMLQSTVPSLDWSKMTLG